MEENSNSDLKEDILAIDRIKISPKKVLIGLSEWLSSEWLSTKSEKRRLGDRNTAVYCSPKCPNAFGSF